MAVRDDFSAGEVLAAADLNDTFASKVDYALPTNAQTGTTYTFVAADAEKLTTASNAAAVTLTIPPASSVAWPDNTVLRVVNYGAGAVTIDGGSGVTVTNTASTIAQYGAAVAIRTGSDAWTVVPFSGGAGDADFSNSATGTYTDSGVDYKYVTFTASGTLTVTQEGYADILVVGGGGGAVQRTSLTPQSRAGGGGGAVRVGTYALSVGSTTVTVGAGGAGSTSSGSSAGNDSKLVGVLNSGAGQGAKVFFLPASPSAVDGWGGAGGAGGVCYSDSGTLRKADGGGAGGLADGASLIDGISSDITGSAVTYGTGGDKDGSTAGAANTGDGGDCIGATNGGSGVVIVRVRTN